MTCKDCKEFRELCIEILIKARIEERGVNYVNNDDLSVIYRLLNRLGVWRWLNDKEDKPTKSNPKIRNIVRWSS